MDTALFQAAYPDCWKTHKACNSQLTDSVSYSQIAGIIVGMLSVGFIADRIGRKWGSVMTAAIMFIGKPGFLDPVKWLSEWLLH